MEVDEDYDPSLISVTVEYRLEDSNGFIQSKFAWTEEIAKKYYIGQNIKIMFSPT